MGEYSGAGGNQKHDDCQSEQRNGYPFFTPCIGHMQNDHQHGKGQKHRAKIGRTVSPQRCFQAGGKRQKCVADVDDQNRGKQQNEPLPFFAKHKAAPNQKQSGKHSGSAVNVGQTCSLFTDGIASGQIRDQQQQGERPPETFFHKISPLTVWSMQQNGHPTLFPTLFAKKFSNPTLF